MEDSLKEIILDLKKEIVLLGNKNNILKGEIKDLEKEKEFLERRIGNQHSVNSMKDLGVLQEKIFYLEKELNNCINLAKKI